MAGAVRTFVCIELPDRDRERLEAVSRGFAERDVRVAWVAPVNMHVTLAFLGDVAIDIVPTVIETVRTVATTVGPLSLAVRGMGAFPNARRPRVLWAGLSGDVPELTKLAATIDSALGPLGFGPSGKPFRAHVTLGRIKADRDPAAARLASEAERVALELEPFTAAEVVVMRSDLEPRGARYTPLARLPLTGPPTSESR